MIHKVNELISLEKLRNTAAEKNLYIWGAGNQGRGMNRVLRENGFAPLGYIDNSPEMIGREVSGVRVESPNIISEIPKENLFIVISAFFYEQEISDICRSHGLKQGENFIHYSALKPRDYSMDISDSCNLRCISCPRASRRNTVAAGALMSLESFRAVIDKLKSEDPFVGNIQLYQWGEPTLNKELPRMISYAREKDIYSAVSSNLNNSIDYHEVIASRPEWFRISASGWGEHYEVTHSGGRWDKFLKNLTQVALLRKKLYPEMKIELFYHLYKHSVGESLFKIQALCGELSIEFHPVYAYLISVDDILKYQEGVPLPNAAREAKERMLLDLNEGLRIARSEAALPCDAFRSIHINSDLSVSNCMMYFYPEANRAVDNYLEKGIDEIMEIRRYCDLCRRCIKYGIHRYCRAYSTYKPNIYELIKNG